MKKYADIINEERATLSQIIQSENYFLTNIDMWILAVYFKIPIIYVSQSLLSENGKNMMVLYGDDDSNSYFFVHPFTVTQDVPSRFGLIEVKEDEYSLIKVPLEFVTPELRENIQTENDERVSLEDYIRTFKLGNIKNKKRVFTMTEPAEPVDDGGGGGGGGGAALPPLPAVPVVPAVPAVAAGTPQLSSNLSLFQ
jgi:hypothetical protein